MKLSNEQIKQKLKDTRLRVTPQLHAILEAVYTLGNHPNAEQIFDFIRRAHPGIAMGTVYNVLDAMRYDGVLQKHHHIYCAETDRIEDYFDEELDDLLQEYFSRKKLTNFKLRISFYR